MSDAKLCATPTCLFVFLASLFVQTFCAAADEARNPAIEAAISSERMPGDRAEDGWRQPRAILGFLEIAPGQHALDFFAGPGYYSELMARVVGPAGSVLIFNDELYSQAAHHDLMKRLGRNRLPNAKQLKGPSNYLKLAPESLDRVLFVMVYHDLYWQPGGSPQTLGNAQKVLTTLRAALKPGGLIVVVDHVANDTSRDDLIRVASRMHRIDPKIVLDDFKQAGFEFAGESDVLRNAQDDHTKSVFDMSVRRRTDQFIYKFRKPL